MPGNYYYKFKMIGIALLALGCGLVSCRDDSLKIINNTKSADAYCISQEVVDKLALKFKPHSFSIDKPAMWEVNSKLIVMANERVTSFESECKTSAVEFAVVTQDLEGSERRGLSPSVILSLNFVGSNKKAHRVDLPAGVGIKSERFVRTEVGGVHTIELAQSFDITRQNEDKVMIVTTIKSKTSMETGK